MNEDLREALAGAADDVRNVDLYDRALARSGRIRRNRAIAASASALAVLGLAGVGLSILPLGHRPSPPPSVASPTLPMPAPSVPATPSKTTITTTTLPTSTTAAPRTTPPTTPASPAATLAVPRSVSLADLPGRVFFRSDDGRVVRLTGGRTGTVLTTANEAAAVAPDGTAIAYLAGGKVWLAGSKQPIFTGSTDAAAQPLLFTPDGRKLLIAAPRSEVLTVADGSLGALPAGQSFVYSGDGRTLIYGTADCRLKVAPAAGGTGRTVPVLGDPSGAVNPEQVAGCIPLSSDPAGDRVTVPLQGIGIPSGFSQADTLIDTGTGAVVPVPVAGGVQAMRFAPGGDLLVQSRDGEHLVLSVFSPGGDLLVQARQPAAITGDLLAYTG